MTTMLFAREEGSHSPASTFFSIRALKYENGSSPGDARSGSVSARSGADYAMRVRITLRLSVMT